MMNLSKQFITVYEGKACADVISFLVSDQNAKQICALWKAMEKKSSNLEVSQIVTIIRLDLAGKGL